MVNAYYIEELNTRTNIFKSVKNNEYEFWLNWEEAKVKADELKAKMDEKEHTKGRLTFRVRKLL